MLLSERFSQVDDYRQRCFFENPLAPMKGSACPLGWMIRWLPEDVRKEVMPIFKTAIPIFKSNYVSIDDMVMIPVVTALMNHYGLTIDQLFKLQVMTDSAPPEKVKEYMIAIISKWEREGKLKNGIVLSSKA